MKKDIAVLYLESVITYLEGIKQSSTIPLGWFSEAQRAIKIAKKALKKEK